MPARRTNSGHPRWTGTLVVLLLAAIWAGYSVGPASAQEADPSAATGFAGEVDLDILQFGTGKLCRAGELTGVQLELQDRLTRPRGIILRLSITDADGDQMLAQVAVAASPGQKLRPWVYPRVPFNAAIDPLFQLQAFEEIVGGDGAQTGRPGKLIGQFTYRVPSGAMAPPYSGLMAVVGRQLLNLDRYTVRTGSGFNCSPFGHEVVHSIAQLRPGNKGLPGELPDRWYGLQQFSEIVWVATGADGEPTDLTPGQAEAMREWVDRGGHLVIVLPSAGQAWIGVADNPLAAIMPRMSVKRLEGVDLNPLRLLLLGKPDNRPHANRRLPDGQIVHQFSPLPGANPSDAMRLLTTPTNECIVARRLVGIGAVTVVGLDLTTRQMLQAGGVEPDVFWHRVLGRRGVLVDQQRLATSSNTLGFGIDRRGPYFLDIGIKGEISKSAAAGAGLMLAFIVFGAYWVLAGPLGFAALRKKQWSQHSWLVFVAVGAAFTALAWGGATVLRPMTISARHISILDHVHGQDTERARTFASVLLPRYGEMSISVADPDNRYHNSLFSWDQPQERPTASKSFPDSRGYPVDGRHPAEASFPARFTTKDLQIDWAGGPRWRTIHPVTETAPKQFAEGGELKLVKKSATTGILSGMLSHQLPKPLENVVIVVVEGQNLSLETSSAFMVDRNAPQSLGAPRLPGRTPGDFFAFQLSDSWAPGTVIDLSTVTKTGQGTGTPVNLGNEYLKRLVPSASRFSEEIDRDNNLVSNLVALSFFSVLQPPEFGTGQLMADELTLVRRRSTHGLDLSRWFTQPCVIIVGQMGTATTEDTCPVPLLIDVPPEERATATPLRAVTGRTVVRWVYPLPDQPTAYAQTDATDPDPTPKP